jgi:tetratricopeptide (TPR) repeat protein
MGGNILMNDGAGSPLPQNLRFPAAQTSMVDQPTSSVNQKAAPCAGLSALLDPALEPILRCAARSGAPSAWWSHVPFAHWMVRAAAPRVLVELGTQHGVSYSAFCEAVLEERLPTRCHAVDSWLGDRHAGEYGEEVYEDFRRFHDQRYAAFSTVLRSTFNDATSWFADGTIDLLHIDGLHTYEAVRHDFEHWLPKLSKRGVVLFHDTNVRRDDFGVWRLWEELSRQYPSFEFLHGYGLGILAVGDDTPEEVLDLCRLGEPEEIAALRRRFALIGEQCERVDGVGNAVVAAQAAQAEVAALRTALAGREAAAMARAEQMADERETALADANRRNAELTAKLTRAEETLAEHMARSADERARTERQAAEQRRRMEHLHAELSAVSEELAAREQALADAIRLAEQVGAELRFAQSEFAANDAARDLAAEQAVAAREERDRLAAESARWFDAAILAVAEDVMQPPRARRRPAWLPGWRAKRRAGFSTIARADRARDEGRWEKAARFYAEALRRHPDRPAIWIQLGHALKEASKIPEAEAAYRRATELAPDNCDALLRLGALLKLRGRKAEAIAACIRARDLAGHGEMRDVIANELAALGYDEGG